MSGHDDIAEARRLIAAKEFDGAEALLVRQWPDALRRPVEVHLLLGNIHYRQRRFLDAERCYRQAIAADERNPAAHAELARFLAEIGFHAHAAESFATARRLDPKFPGALLGYAQSQLAARKLAEAEAAFREAIAIEGSAAAWEGLSRTLRLQERLEEAVDAARAALKLAPGDLVASHALATALAANGENEEALRVLEEVEARGVRAPALTFVRGTALFNLTRTEEAEAAFVSGVERWPFNANMHKALANARWMRGASDHFTRDFERAVERRSEDVVLRLECADLLRRADLRERAEALLRRGLETAPENAGLLTSLGVLLDEMDRTGEGLPLIAKAQTLAPNQSGISANLACALLRLERPQEALAEIAKARAAEPLNQEWICYETMALRQMGDPRYAELCDYERMVRAYDLPTPPGFADIEAFNEALSESLKRLHVLQSHPLDQSLRGGSQTSRSLLHVKDPFIEAYIRALDGPIRAYMDAMGPAQPGHPWSGRKTGAYRLTGCWSVRLKPKGYHINHLHPAGWISSAYYVSVPAVTASESGREGWIKFGEPRWPTPKCTTEKVVQPKAGRLVLFPSYMWHGTIPFSQGERITAPFDAVPA